ncbi:MAG: LuxR C-terminal-related transcriptional regulator [Defluviitaleaceae bacterium]|nr:LuxR C-terminal-related transcriptional regulator [Defluviitaleaceae bacterium]
MQIIGSTPIAPREALMRFLDGLSSKRFIYIHAPAGYGKSFSVRMWMARRAAPSAWVSVNNFSGRKPSEFCERFADALFALQPDNEALEEIVGHKSFSTAPFEFIKRALKVFRSYATDTAAYTLAVDDLHLVTNPHMLKTLPDLFHELPECTNLFILSRAEPPDGFSGFVVKNMMSVVDAEYLRFTENEIKTLFESGGHKLTALQASDILTSTGGWAIGLNAILLSGGYKKRRKLLSRYLETFIREQIWEKWEAKRRDFLIDVSVAEELTADFCDAVTGKTNSADILDALVRENAFVSVDDEGIYRFHHLFLDFLRHGFERASEKRKNAVHQAAGNWFYKRGNYYKAVEHYIKSGNKKEVTRSLKRMYDYNSPYAAIEDTLSIIRLSVGGSIVDEYPFLLEVQAWTAFVEGRGTDMEEYLDRYFKQLPKIILQNPASAQTALLLRCMDYRNSMIEVTKKLRRLPLKLFGQSNTPSLSQNMPHFHCSVRDFSEYVSEGDKGFVLFKKTIGVLIGEESEAIILLINGGLAYERGNLNDAYEYALSANTKVKDSFAPEIQFNAFMFLTSVLEAQGHHAEAQRVLDNTSAMIERHKAYYLNANFRAFICRLKMAKGDREAARDWLNHDAEPMQNTLSFYKLYQHFTTARALIVTGDLNMAILLLKKVYALCEQYRRTLGVIEANILLAIAYWKKVRGTQNDALMPLEKAILTAREYGYTQLFANEGADISNMLHKLQKRVIQKDYAGALSALEIKSLYFTALTRAKHSPGLTGGRVSENLTFTRQQKTIVRYINDGLTQKEIAERMGIKPSSVKVHATLIYKKLDVSNLTDAIIKIRELGVPEGD